MGTTPKAASRLEAAHHRRGPSVCSNNLTIPMEQADDAVLCAIEDVVLAPAIVDSVVDQVIEQVQAARGANRRPAIEREMATIEQEISRLAGAIASGGDVPAIVGAIQQREQRRRELRAALACEATPSGMLDVRHVRSEAQRLLDPRRGA